MSNFGSDKESFLHKRNREFLDNQKFQVETVLYVAQCAYCGFEQRIPPSKAKRNKLNFCSKDCEKNFKQIKKAKK